MKGGELRKMCINGSLKGALALENIEIQVVSDAMPKSPLGDLGVKK